MENDGTFYITYGEEKLEARRDNTSLFMFWGDLASRNHVFVVMEEGDSSNLGTYLFDPDCTWFDSVATYMIDQGFPAHLNIQEVPDCDEAAYQRYVSQRAEKETEEMGDFIPDWFDDEKGSE